MTDVLKRAFESLDNSMPSMYVPTELILRRATRSVAVRRTAMMAAAATLSAAIATATVYGVADNSGRPNRDVLSGEPTQTPEPTSGETVPSGELTPIEERIVSIVDAKASDLKGKADHIAIVATDSVAAVRALGRTVGRQGAFDAWLVEAEGSFVCPDCKGEPDSYLHLVLDRNDLSGRAINIGPQQAELSQLGEVRRLR